MLTNAEIKHISSLKNKKERAESKEFVVESEKLVAEAIASGFTIKMICYTGKVLPQIQTHHSAVEVDEKTMERISLLSSPSPALAVVAFQIFSYENVINTLAQKSDSLCLALDGVRDPGNLGTIIRLADWFGIDAVFASPGTVDVYNPKVVQATVGAIFRKKVIYCNLEDVILKFSEAGAAVYGTFLEGKDIYKADVKKHALVVMGSESDGISSSLQKIITDKLFIPPYPRDYSACESLNVAVATSIICFAFRNNLYL